MTKRKWQKDKQWSTKYYKKNLKIEQYKPLKEPGVKSGAPEGLTVRHYEIIGESKYIKLLIVVYLLKTDWLIEKKETHDMCR